MLRKTLFAAGAVCLFAGAASAHDFDTVFATRAECQQALQDINKADFFDVKPLAKDYGFKPGDARSWLAHNFKCEQAGGGWMQVYVGTDPL